MKLLKIKNDSKTFILIRVNPGIVIISRQKLMKK